MLQVKKTKVNKISQNMFEQPLSCKTCYTCHQSKPTTFSQTNRKSNKFYTFHQIICQGFSLNISCVIQKIYQWWNMALNMLNVPRKNSKSIG